MKKKSLKVDKQLAAATSTAASAELPKLGAAKKLAVAKLVNAKLSTAKLMTLRRLGG